MTNQEPIENALDSDLRLSRPALQRAALRARELARQTGTAIVISKNGFIERISPLSIDDTLRVHEQSPDYLK